MTKEHGGVGEFFFPEKESSMKKMKHITTNLECIVFKIDELGLIIATIFRPENAF